jgi:hypothetical protein
MEGPIDELAALLVKIETAETDVDDAEAALNKAKERDPEGTGSAVSRKEQILLESQKTLNLLYEEKKRLTAGTAGECVV